ncbi:MAG: ATP synthase F1 subunit delta [Pseudomonadota bacterium]
MAQASASLTSEAAQRYANALFELAQDKGQLADINTSFADFAALARDNEDLSRLLASPRFSREDKAAALGKIGQSAGLPALLVNFLGVMATNGRARDILGAQRAFDEIYAKQRGVKRAVARTTTEMTPQQLERLQGVIAKAVGGDVELTTEVDPSLIGGVQLRIGSTLIDASLKAKLDRLNTAMKGA